MSSTHRRPRLVSEGTFDASGKWDIFLTAAAEERSVRITFDSDSLRVEMIQHLRPRQRGLPKVLDEFEILLPESVSAGKFTNEPVWDDFDVAWDNLDVEGS